MYKKMTSRRIKIVQNSTILLQAKVQIYLQIFDAVKCLRFVTEDILVLELLYHKRNHLITTVVDGSNCTSYWEGDSPECFFGNFEIFKNHEGDLSPKSPKPKMWLLFNHAKQFIVKLISFNSRQLRISERAITK